MYYDLIASLPHLPHFSKAERLPITPLRLEQRLRLLRPAHAEQLTRARALVRWRPARAVGKSDAALVAEYAALMESPLEPALREFVAFRIDRQTLLAALRRKQAGTELPSGKAVWGAGPRVSFIRQNFGEPDFRLAHVYRWLPQARELLAAGDARGLEHLLMDAVWRWLNRLTERNTFGFEAVIAYVFKWDLLRAQLASNAETAKVRFSALIDQVTNAQPN